MKRIVLFAAILALCAGCAVTTPKGVYSLALTGDQVGFAKDVVAQLGNLYLEIEAQEAALVEAQVQGKTDRVASILEKIANLKAKAAEKQTIVSSEVSEAVGVLEDAPEGVK